MATPPSATRDGDHYILNGTKTWISNGGIANFYVVFAREISSQDISAFVVPGRWPRSVYLKARDRQSYEFALASAAVALDLQDGVINDARLALGGVATVPWRAREAEAFLKGQRFDDTLAQHAADAAFADARGRQHNAFKIALGKRVVAHALKKAAAMEI